MLPKRLLLIIIIFQILLCVIPSASAQTVSNPVTQEDIRYYLNLFNYERYTAANKNNAKNTLVSEFNKIGGYTVSVKGSSSYPNVEAAGPDSSSQYILVGAHYDTVAADVIGADDNLSAMAMMLAIAKRIPNKSGIRFVAFDGEETGLGGSSWYAQNVTPLPLWMIALETVGYYSDAQNSQQIPFGFDYVYPDQVNQIRNDGSRGNFSTIACTTVAMERCQKFSQQAPGRLLKVIELEIPSNSTLAGDLLRSDHAAFIDKGVPSGMITDTADYRNPNYHKASDTLNTINVEFITKQANALLAAITQAGPTVTLQPTGVTPQPTLIKPTPTIPAGSTGLSLSLFLHGLGKAGDNVTPGSNGTVNPLHPQRTVTIELLDAANQLVLTKQGNVTYAPQTGNFQGLINLGNVTTGVYTLKLKSPQYLRKTFPGILSLTSGQTKQLESIALVTGDTNSDNVLALADYEIIMDCYANLGQPKNCTDANKKLMADITDDGSVNQFDYNLFLRELSVQAGE